MNAIIDVNGNLKITALSPTEAFALKVWWEDYNNTGNKYGMSIDATTHSGDGSQSIAGLVATNRRPEDFMHANEEHSNRVRGK